MPTSIASSRKASRSQRYERHPRQSDEDYVYQHAVLERRAALVEKLYAAPAAPEVIS